MGSAHRAAPHAFREDTSEDYTRREAPARWFLLFHISRCRLPKLRRKGANNRVAQSRVLAAGCIVGPVRKTLSAALRSDEIDLKYDLFDRRQKTRALPTVLTHAPTTFGRAQTYCAVSGSSDMSPARRPPPGLAVLEVAAA